MLSKPSLFPDHLSHFYVPTKRAAVAAYSARGGSYHAGRRERFSTRIKGLPSTYSSGPYSEAKGKRSSRNLRRVGGSFSEERGRFLSASFSSPPPDPLFPGTKFPRAAGAHPAKGLPTDWKFERTKPSQTISVLRIALFSSLQRLRLWKRGRVFNLNVQPANTVCFALSRWANVSCVHFYFPGAEVSTLNANKNSPFLFFRHLWLSDCSANLSSRFEGF